MTEKWVVDADDGEDAEGLPVLYVIVPGDDDTVCDVRSEPDYENDGWHITDKVRERAALIAAAPELKEVLKEIVEADDLALAEYQAMGLGEPPAKTKALTEKARAVLAKAEESTDG